MTSLIKDCYSKYANNSNSTIKTQTMGMTVSCIQSFCSCPTSCVHKDGPWAWNTSLGRVKVPTVGCARFITFCGNSFPCFSLNEYSLHLCLRVCILWHLANPTALSVLQARMNGVPCICSKWGGKTCWPWGTDAHYRSWFSFASSLSK